MQREMWSTDVPGALFGWVYICFLFLFSFLAKNYRLFVCLLKFSLFFCECSLKVF